MRKVLIISTLLLSFNTFAATISPQNSLLKLGSAIKNATKNHSNVQTIKNSFPMIYGGQDISRPLLATANESIWSGQRSFIG